MKNKVENKGAAQLTINGKTYDLPVLAGSVGPDVIDIRTLYRDAGVFTYDPGFTSTASCESQITYIDGDEGVLLYRGYPIDQLADNASFIETAYLLLHGDLPTKDELHSFDWTIRRHTMLHDQFDQFFRGFRRDAHPMAIMVGTVGALSAFYHDSTDINDLQARTISAHRMIAKMPTIAARAYKYSIGQPFITPRNELDYAGNFLRMCFAVPAEDYEVSPPSRAPWTRFSSCTPITSRTPPPPRCVWPALRVPIPLPALRRGSPRCGVRPMAVPMKPRSPCSKRSARLTAFPNMSARPRTRMILSA